MSAISFRSALLWSMLLFAFSLLSATSCKKDDDDSMPVVPACDSTLTPIVFVHGFLASGDTYAAQVQRFESNDYCSAGLFVFDWNTLGTQDAAVQQLNLFIDNVLANTGATKVNLVGHSAGGGLGYNFLADASRAAKVERYAHLGSSAQSGPAGPNGSIPTLNVWSDGDKVVQSADIPGATNVQLPNLDHYQVATGPATFETMFKFFNGDQLPVTTAITAEDEVELSGRVVTLGENAPQAGATITIYSLDAATGNRKSTTPDAVLAADANGNWGPWPAAKATYYEFFVRTTTAGDRPIHYYREPFTRSNRQVYLRTFPPPTSLAGLLLAGIPKNDNQSVLAVFSANQAVVEQRDQLMVNNFNLATNQYASAERTTIAFFLYDNGDNQTSGNTHAAFNFLQAFLTGVDYYIPTALPASIKMEFNGRSMAVPNLRSETDGVIVAVFD